MTFATSHLPRYLQVALVSDASRPRLTYYDDATGERVELSAQTLANWVTKTTNLLVDDLAVESGARVSLHLPLHWLAGVWLIAADAAGAEVITPVDQRQNDHQRRPEQSSGDHVDVAVVAGRAEHGDPLGLPRAHEVFAVSLAPMATPLGPALPAGTRDYCAEVRTMPDQIVMSPEQPGALGERAAMRAASMGLREQERISVTPEQDQARLDDLIDGLLAPLGVDGSAVWTRHADPASYPSRWQTEQVSAVVGALPEGRSLPPEIRHLV